ncbi:MAG: winged helix-turn-helix domain-containing protein [Anaerolineae bacterium]
MLQSVSSRNHIQYGGIELNSALRSVTACGKSVRLTPIEYRLLSVLVAEGGRTVSADQLLHRVWGKGYEGSDNYLWVHLSRLRRKLDTLVTPSLVVNERGAGYRVRRFEASREP